MNPANPDDPASPLPPTTAAADWRSLLLHRLPDDQAQALEQRLLDDPQALDALRDAGHDLIDDYAQDRLPPAERAAFEAHVLPGPQAAERLRFSRALHAQAEVLRTRSESPVPGAGRPPLPRRPRFGEASPRPRRRRGAVFALAGSALAILLAFAALQWPVVTSRTPADPSATAATVVLLAAVERGHASPVATAVNVPAGVTQLRVQAEVDQPDDTARYRLMMFAGTAATADEPVLRIEHLPLLSAGRYRYVEAMLPVTPLAAGPRTIRVEAEAPAAPFAFDWTLDARPAPGR